MPNDDGFIRYGCYKGASDSFWPTLSTEEAQHLVPWMRVGGWEVGPLCVLCLKGHIIESRPHTENECYGQPGYQAFNKRYFLDNPPDISHPKWTPEIQQKKDALNERLMRWMPDEECELWDEGAEWISKFKRNEATP